MLNFCLIVYIQWRRPTVTDGNKRYWKTRLSTLQNYEIIIENAIFESFLAKMQYRCKQLNEMNIHLSAN